MSAEPRLYLDHNATAPLRPEAMAAAVAAMRAGGNASSVHAEGRAARAAIERARAAVGRLAGVSPGRVTFTSGATEAAATLLQPDWTAQGRPLRFARLIVSAVEHPCILRGGRFAAGMVSELPVDADGIVRLDHLEALLAEGPGPVLVAVQLANSETGVIQPIEAVAGMVRGHGGILVCDAVQAAGRLPLARVPADCLMLSGHKIGGLAGAGAIVARDDGGPVPLLTGGGQERNRRAGTEALPAIAAFGAAAEAAVNDLQNIGALTDLRDWLRDALRTISPTLTVIGENADRLPNTLCVALPGVAAETAVIAFDLEGVAVSAGSACSSGKVGASHVLKAMGMPDAAARGGLRISLGWSTQRADVERFIGVWRRVVARLGSGSGRAA
ncbi:cysteine desulfurase family protein [Prosthecodimorpha staleyi]|uniref:Cysteine desulfurase n=1 Tax=Prosthecodimorpha staleyi TaxID=2840188 RepID=A0A947G9R1_9HYPH|nr:cysteine desulfurase family protein [Prosthecodimorpha staleyi]MBT9288228.1 cysteine desulfurase [Prosthecodimorpha staleyi]